MEDFWEECGQVLTNGFLILLVLGILFLATWKLLELIQIL